MRGKGFVERLMKAVLAARGVPNAVSWSAPGRKGFSERYGFRCMRTTLANFAGQGRLRSPGNGRQGLPNGILH
jgi:hypothetical protein